mgnify:CR=1 FL=1
MRTLNRPMFRMGGPIKQGIMHGIREPRNMGGRAALVGNPVFPKDSSGRAHHSVWSAIYGVGSKVLPKAGGIISKGWSKIKPDMIPRMKITQPSTTVPIGMRGRIQDRITQTPRTNWEMVKGFAKKNPYWTAGGAIYGGPAAGELGVKAATGPGWSLVKQAADLAVPDWIWDQDKWEANRAAQKELEKNLENKVGKKTYGPYKKSDKVTKLKAKTKDERINELLEIMGYDKARKTAVGDALIDASRIITERGTLDKKNIGRDLINPIIEATSKRLDKPEQIREAVGLMEAKANIEANQPSTKLKDLIAIGIDTPEKQEMYLKSQLGQPTTWGAAKSIASKANLTGDNAISAAASQFADNFQGNLLTTKSFKEIIEAPANKGKKESDIIVEFTEKAVKTKGYPPGDYTVGGVLVTVDENGKVTNITR